MSTVEPVVGQSGSIVVLTGRFPPQTGDNSSVVGILFGGVPTELLVAVRGSLTLTVRAGPSPTAIPGAIITVITNYSSFNVAGLPFNYTAPANITMVTPARGQAGTRVVITGVNLDVPLHDLSQVLLAGNEVTVVSNNDTTIVCTVNSSSPSNGSVVLNYTRSVERITYDGPTVIINNTWEQLEDGIIDRIIPATAAVNQTVLACGDRLLGGGNEIVSVLIGNIRAIQFSNTTTTIANSTCINVTLPSGLAGSLSITLTADTGATIRSTVDITIASITSVSPDFGQYGTRVNITGVELFGNLSSTTVTLAGVDATIEMADTTSRSWIIALAGRLPMFSRTIETENCTNECTPVSNITSQCSSINCTESFSNATFLTESCLSSCLNQTVSMCFNSCSSVDGMLNEMCFLLCENSTAINDNSTRCINDCAIPCCTNTSSNCSFVTTCANVTKIESFEGSFSGLVAIVTQELGLTFNLTNSSVSWTYNIIGSIETVVPSSGQLGTRVALNGTNLYGYGTSLQELRINNTIASDIVSQNSTYIVFRAPSIGGDPMAVGLVNIRLISDTGAIVELTEGFEYLPAGRITSLAPAGGQLGTFGMLAVCSIVSVILIIL